MSTHRHNVGFLSFEDSILKEKYDFYRAINRGSFGVVYEVKNKLTNKISALKIEYRDDNSKKNRFFINEIHILKKLQGISGIPEIRDFGKCQKGCYFEI
jgi:serine/threonine protein kinase